MQDLEDHPSGYNDGHTAPGDDFLYDLYGNLILDRDKGIAGIFYNHLNLPITIDFTNGGKIEYFYDATGKKLKKKVTDGSSITTTEYMDGFQYTNTLLDFFPHAEGYVKAIASSEGGPGSPPGFSFKYVFSYTDHTSAPLSTGLGNIRLKYAEDPSNNNAIAILEEDHYYPGACPERSRRGLKHKGYNSIHWTITLGNGPDPGIVLTPVNPFLGDSYKYKYNGKELNEDLGLNLIDYGWRNYDPSLARWIGIDKMSEKYYSNSPYHYADNNPVMNFDINGNEFTSSARDWINMIMDEIKSRSERNRQKNLQNQETLDMLRAKGRGESGRANRLQKRIERRKRENESLNEVSVEISVMDNSNQVYDVVRDSGGTKRDMFGNSTTTNRTNYNFENGNVEITVSSGTRLSLFAHELKHAYQFETGEASLGERGGRGFSFLLDKHDELESHNREALFNRSLGALKSINDLSTSYDGLPSGPINIHTLNPAVNTAIKTNNALQLQSLANQRRQAYRVNNKTYSPN